MIDKINGTELSNLYRLSLPKALSFLGLKINELIILSNNKLIKKDEDLLSLLTQSNFDTNPNIQLSKDKWI